MVDDLYREKARQSKGEENKTEIYVERETRERAREADDDDDDETGGAEGGAGRCWRVEAEGNQQLRTITLRIISLNSKKSTRPS